MIKVGLTGGIGSGKSYISNIFRQLGAPVFCADTEAKLLLFRDDVIKFYKKNFGENVFTNSVLDTKKIAQLIFNDKQALQMVNAFIHPLVKETFDNWCLTFSTSPYIIKEAALLCEGGAYQDLDHLILVTAPLEIKIERVQSRDSISREDVLRRISNQWADDEKRKLADYEIINDNISPVLKQVLDLHTYFTNLKQTL